MECIAVQTITDERGEPHKKVERIASAGTFIRPIGLGIPEIPYAIQWVVFKGLGMLTH